MTQQLVQTPYSNKNYMMGGIRMLLKDLATGHAGFQFVGNMHSPDMQPILEIYEHYQAASGAEAKDFESPSKTGYKIGYTADELLVKNLKRYLYGGAITEVAADASATAGPETFTAGLTGDLHGLEYGEQTSAQRTALAVYNVTDAADLVLDTDYSVVTIYGWTFIKMLVDTHAADEIRVGTGATASTAYEYDKKAHKLFAPLSNLSQDVAAIMLFPAKKGPNFWWRVDKAIIKPDGSLGLSAKEATSKKMVLEVLDNSAAEPSYPFGKFGFLGYDDAGAALL